MDLLFEIILRSARKAVFVIFRRASERPAPGPCVFMLTQPVALQPSILQATFGIVQKPVGTTVPLSQLSSPQVRCVGGEPREALESYLSEYMVSPRSVKNFTPEIVVEVESIRGVSIDLEGRQLRKGTPDASHYSSTAPTWVNSFRYGIQHERARCQVLRMR